MRHSCRRGGDEGGRGDRHDLYGSGVEENWAAFRNEFSSQGWLAFSDALLADDQLIAGLL
jgi:hypothetical protein